MERIEGKLDLDSYFKHKTYHELVANGTIKNNMQFKNRKDENDRFTNFMLNVDNITYYVKESNYPVTELVVEEFAKLLGFDNAHYDLATFDGIDYVISPSYKKTGGGYDYVTGHDILSKYYKYLKREGKDYLELINSKELFGGYYHAYYLNNLENIWMALSYYFKVRYDRDEIVYKLVTELKRRFFFKSLLLFDADYHPCNWEMEIDASVNLCPMFDNESCLISDIYGVPFGIMPEYTNESISNHLQAFLSYSSDIDILEFIELFNKATPELFKQAIEMVLKRTSPNLEIPNVLLEKYTTNYEKLKNIINEYRGKNGR